MIDQLSSIRLLGGDDTKTTKVVVKACWIVGTYYGIWVDKDCTNGVVEINGGHIQGDFNNKYNGLGILNQGHAKVYINGGTIQGHGSALELQGGELNITGGEFISSQTEFNRGGVAEVGNTLSGSAIVVSPRTDIDYDLNINISGGTFGGNGQYSFYFACGEVMPRTYMEITGGTYNSGIWSEGPVQFISGGKYKVKPGEALLASKAYTEQEGDYTIVKLKVDVDNDTSLPSWGKEELGNN